jgi:hypothetical protein
MITLPFDLSSIGMSEFVKPLGVLQAAGYFTVTPLITDLAMILLPFY